jgi:hypothetical protein
VNYYRKFGESALLLDFADQFRPFHIGQHQINNRTIKMVLLQRI